MVFIEVVASDGGHRAIEADKSVSSVKAALAALCFFRTRKKSQCLSVSVFKKKHFAADSFVVFLK